MDLDHEHAAFRPLIGSWTITMTTHSADGERITSAAVRSDKRWFGAGRYVQEQIAGTFGGKPHDKVTVLGFNPTRARYEYVTADDHDAVIILSTSRPGEAGDGREINLFAEYLMPAESGGGAVLVTLRTHLSIPHATGHVLRNFYRAPGGEERLFLEYRYQRTGA